MTREVSETKSLTRSSALNAYLDHRLLINDVWTNVDNGKTYVSHRLRDKRSCITSSNSVQAIILFSLRCINESATRISVSMAPSRKMTS